MSILQQCITEEYLTLTMNNDSIVNIAPTVKGVAVADNLVYRLLSK